MRRQHLNFPDALFKDYRTSSYEGFATFPFKATTEPACSSEYLHSGPSQDHSFEHTSKHSDNLIVD